MAEKDILIKKHNGVDWDNIYPVTKGQNVILADSQTLENALAARVNKNGDIFTGNIALPAATTAYASLTIPHGTAPTSPVNGDIWTTTSGVLARINGTTRTLAHTSQWSLATQAEAEAGASTTARLWSPERVNQAISALAPLKKFTIPRGSGTVTWIRLAVLTAMSAGSGNGMSFLVTGTGDFGSGSADGSELITATSRSVASEKITVQVLTEPILRSLEIQTRVNGTDFEVWAKRGTYCAETTIHVLSAWGGSGAAISLGTATTTEPSDLTTITRYRSSSRIDNSLSSHTGDMTAHVTSAERTAWNAKANSTITITAGNGLSGGGTLAANRDIALGTPSTLSPTSTNAVTATSHTHDIATATQAQAEAGIDTTSFTTPQRVAQAIVALSPVKSVAGKTGVITLAAGDIASGVFAAARLPAATTSTQGAVILSSSLSSNSQTTAATSKAINDLYNMMGVTETLSTYLSDLDVNGIFKTVEKRNSSGNLRFKSVLSGGSSPQYLYRIVYDYAEDGTTVIKTTTMSLTYNMDGVLVSEAVL